MLSGYVVCWMLLQIFQTYFCIMANSVDPDQTAQEQSDQGPQCLQKWLLKSQADDKQTTIVTSPLIALDKIRNSIDVDTSAVRLSQWAFATPAYDNKNPKWRYQT